MGYDEEEVRLMLLDLHKRSKHLNDWETDFIYSIQHQVDTLVELSNKQLEVLEDLWARITDKYPRV